VCLGAQLCEILKGVYDLKPEVEGLWVQGWSRQKHKTLKNKVKVKGLGMGRGGVAQVEKHLPSKFEAQVQSPILPKKWGLQPSKTLRTLNWYKSLKVPEQQTFVYSLKSLSCVPSIGTLVLKGNFTALGPHR
jgi:hypothetical protein